MLFSSLVFIFMFLPITLVLYYAIPKKHVNIRNMILLLMSLLFYSWGEPKYILLMLFSIILNYMLGLLIDKYTEIKKIILVVGIIINIVLLAYFKYIGLLINTFNNIVNINLSVPNIIMPIGISFYTFQILSYIIDVFRKKVKVQKNIFTLATYVALFPQLIAGPIVRYETIEKELKLRDESLDNFTNGLRRFIIGLSKKVIIANNVAIFADIVFDGDLSSFGTISVWLALVCYTLQIYFDFSGYSDMAIGLGKMFGFNFLENFNYPYIADSVTDFWRRWHISLSSWFRDYVYIPLGGNRVSNIKWLRNILIVWCLTGLWHGANWNFILWGLFYGIILILEKKVLNKILIKLPKFFRHVYTILIIMIGWLIFRVENVAQIPKYISILFVYKPFNLTDLFMNYMEVIPCFIYILLGIILSLPLFNNIYNKLLNKNNLLIKYLLDIAIFLLFIISIIYLMSSSYNPFIYFRF